MATPTLVQATHNQINTLAATGLNVVLPHAASAGDAIFSIIIGQKRLDPYTQRFDTNPYNNITNAVPAPVLNDNEANTWATVATFKMIDLLESASPAPTYPPLSGFQPSNAAPESVPDWFAEFPSIYLGAAYNVAAGTQSINVRATYLGLNNQYNSLVNYLVGDAVTVTGVNGTYPHQQTYTTYVCIKANPVVTSGSPPVTSNKPVSNGTYWTVVATPATDARFAGGPGQDVYSGLDIVTLDFSGLLAAPLDGVPVTGTSEANPANAGAITTTASGDLLIAVGIQKDANNFAAPNGWTVAYQGKLIGSEEHFIVMYQLAGAAGAYTPGFTNPGSRTAVGFVGPNRLIANQGSAPSDVGANVITGNGPGNAQTGFGYRLPATSPLIAAYETGVLAAAFKHS